MFFQDITRQASRPALAAVVSGLTADTLIETETGWRPAASIRAGERVHSFDGGLRPVRAVAHDWMQPGAASGLVLLPGGRFDNCCDVLLLPAQLVLVDHPDLIVALTRAEDLIGSVAQGRKVTSATSVITLTFDEPEVIWAASGLRLSCPGLRSEIGFQMLPASAQNRARAA